jgi:hypothetical protein
MPNLLINPYVEFDQLLEYWKQADELNAPFKAMLLWTQSTPLESKLTSFVFSNIDELNDMSGNSCWVFTAIPKNVRAVLWPMSKEISYSIGKMLNINPDQFPCMVFFSNFSQPKGIVYLPLKSVLNASSEDDDFLSFFRKIFSLTHQLSNCPEEKRLRELRSAVNSKFTRKHKMEVANIVGMTLSITEIAKNLMGIFTTTK